MANLSPISLQPKPIKIGARVVRHTRAIIFQLAVVSVTDPMVRAILRRSVVFELHPRARDHDPGVGRTKTAGHVCPIRWQTLPQGCDAAASRPHSYKSNRLRNCRRRSGRKNLVQRANSGDLYVRWHATWGMSVEKIHAIKIHNPRSIRCRGSG